MIELFLALVIWAVVHSLTAGSRTKMFVRGKIGERAYQGTYRLAYNLFSAVTLMPLFYLMMTRIPNAVLWSVPMPYQLVNYGLQITALIGLAISLLQTDIWSFIGLRQFGRYLRGEPTPDPPSQFVFGGTYALVRHPLYLFSLIYLWSRPEMTLSSLVLCVWVTLYFWIGSVYEEKRLIQEYGADYEQYKGQVPRLLPIKFSSYAKTSGK
ncbi:MAG: isoprenylcysteine carboxylmethyltransferase family protein [Chloroflexota bacterium]|jgi:methanethiol S-methyltransferase